MFPLHQLAGAGSGAWTLTLSANEDAVNIKTKLEALYGSMVSAVDAVVTVNAGVKIGAPDANSQAMSTGTSWPSGSTLKIINYGMIRGAGGAGAGPGIPGWVGGDALNLGINVTIDNTTTGNIFGGGGGGGHGADIVYHSGTAGGGGGGGGQGDDGGGAGARSTAGITNLGTDGGVGSESGGGTGGAGGIGGGGGGYVGGTGGTGGGWGTAGLGGNEATIGGVPGGGGASAGGAAGKAIDKNGKSVTWIAGNNAVQVKGAVS